MTNTKDGGAALDWKRAEECWGILVFSTQHNPEAHKALNDLWNAFCRLRDAEDDAEERAKP